MSSSLIDVQPVIRVSSVLNRDVKQFGKQYLTDGNEETCWNSDQGLPQFIILDFPTEVVAEQLVIKFQGGFAGKDCCLLGQQPNETNWQQLLQFYPKDISSDQVFNTDNNRLNSVKKLKILFQTSTDLFGRITIYKLDVLGRRLLT